MTLYVYTARIGHRDPDSLDITRKSATGDGLVFAPSWSILRPALKARETAEFLAQSSPWMADDARRLWDEAWTKYTDAYLVEMRESYRRDRAAWERLLVAERRVLLCYCTDATHCHRTILAASILPRLGAVYGGEVGR